MVTPLFRLFYFIGMVTPGKWRAKLAFEQMLLPGGGGGLGQRLVLRKGTVAVGSSCLEPVRFAFQLTSCQALEIVPVPKGC